MIPAAFEYYRPQDMAGVFAILQEHGDDARGHGGWAQPYPHDETSYGGRSTPDRFTRCWRYVRCNYRQP